MDTNAIAAEIRHLPQVYADDVLTLIRALSCKVNDDMKDKFGQEIVRELDVLSDWIEEDIQERANWSEAA